jgi:hypothetical protein
VAERLRAQTGKTTAECAEAAEGTEKKREYEKRFKIISLVQ